MGLSALCSVCGKASKQPHSCTFCGAIVCEEHFDPGTGMCTNCGGRLKGFK